jgi:hypothetical protein
VPTREHDLLAELFRWRPGLAADLLGDMGVAVPAGYKAQNVSESFTDLKTSQYAGDVAVLLRDAGGAMGVVVEIQRREDEDKTYIWPLYIATFRARHRCPAVLLVISPDPRVARWSARTIQTGHPGHTLTPLVLQAEHVPVLTDAQSVVDDPAMGVLSAMFHSTGTQGDKVIRTIVEGTKQLGKTDRKLAERYTDFVQAVVSKTALRILEEMMKTEAPQYYSEFFRNAFAQGKAEGRAAGEAEGRAAGEAEALLVVLAARRVEVPDEARARITACTNLEQLKTWLTRAASITEIDMLFE